MTKSFQIAPRERRSESAHVLDEREKIQDDRDKKSYSLVDRRAWSAIPSTSLVLSSFKD